MAAAALLAFTRALDAAAVGRPTLVARLEAVAIAAALALLVLVTAVSSPLT